MSETDEKIIIDQTLNEMDSILKTVNMKETKLKDITIRVGGKVLKYELVSKDDYPLDKEIRDEYSKALNEKLQAIRSSINAKFNETLRTLQMAKDEYTRKEQILLDKLKKAAPMPDIFMEHARKGISIIKGERVGEMCWLVRRIYAPKTITISDDFKITKSQYIRPEIAAKLVREIYILIVTINEKVTSVSTRKIDNLEFFPHYHQNSPDCWGNWKNATNWKNIDDIIKIADEAESVLSNININSIAKHEPTDLPSIETLKKNLIEYKKVEEIKNENGQTISNGRADDVWTI